MESTEQLEKFAQYALRILAPSTVHEQKETIAVLGEELSFRLLGIKKPDCDEGQDNEKPDCGEGEKHVRSGYDWRDRLKAYLRVVRRETMFTPKDWDLPQTIKFCFADLHWLFDTQFNARGQRRNFLSYAFFLNRILEMHGRYELRDRLNFKEPKGKGARLENERLWCLYLECLEREGEMLPF